MKVPSDVMAGVEMIGDAELRGALTTFLMEKVPTRFFVSGGPDALSRCRLVPKMAVAFPDLVRADHTADPAAIDVALAATIISDTFMWDTEGRPNGPAHARLAAEAWYAHMTETGNDCHELMARALNGVLWHHGVFTSCWKPGVCISGECLLVHVVETITSNRPGSEC